MNSLMCAYGGWHRWITLGINIFGQFQCIRVGEVGVGWCHCQDEAVFLADELHNHVPDLVLDICRLVTDRHLGDARQIYEGQVQH